MDIGEAVEALKRGQLVARSGWNGKGMWIALQIPDVNSKMTEPYVFMKTAARDGDIEFKMRLIPWLCSQADLLADDWCVVGVQGG